jgi:hypothetical protein
MEDDELIPANTPGQPAPPEKRGGFMASLGAGWRRFWAWPWKAKGPVIAVAAIVLFGIIGAASGSGDDDSPAPAAPDATSPAAATTASTTSPARATTAAPTATATPVPPTATPVPPTPTPTQVDPAIALEAFKVVFWTSYEELFTVTLPPAIEGDFYWIDSVDRVDYDIEANHLRINATISFESVYLRDRQEWLDDTWMFYREYSRTVWDGVIKGFETSGTAGIAPDWPVWTPSVELYGNSGRLTIRCPGSLIFQVRQRLATQDDYQSSCTSVP